MKIIKRISQILYLILLAVNLNSCTKNDEPEMSAMINGKQWIAKYKNVEVKFMGQDYDLSGGTDGSAGDTSIILSLLTTSVGNYQIDSPYIVYGILFINDLNNNELNYYYPVSPSGYVNITRNKKNKVSGNFEFTVADNTNTFKITNGEFANYSLQ